MPHPDDAEVERIYRSFWRDKVERADGTLNVRQVKKELADFYFVMENAGKVYDHVTGGRISKLNTFAVAVCSEADAHYREVAAEDVKDVDLEG